MSTEEHGTSLRNEYQYMEHKEDTFLEPQPELVLQNHFGLVEFLFLFPLTIHSISKPKFL